MDYAFCKIKVFFPHRFWLAWRQTGASRGYSSENPRMQKNLTFPFVISLLQDDIRAGCVAVCAVSDEGVTVKVLLAHALLSFPNPHFQDIGFDPSKSCYVTFHYGYWARRCWACG